MNDAGVPLGLLITYLAIFLTGDALEWLYRHDLLETTVIVLIIAIGINFIIQSLRRCQRG